MQQQFKIGDYVVLQNENTYRILNVSTTGNNILLDTNEYPASDNWWSTSSCKPWQPKEGEWCWFWNSSLGIWFISTLKDFGEYNNSIQYRCNSVYYICEKCEPFIGELPSSLKDK